MQFEDLHPLANQMDLANDQTLTEFTSSRPSNAIATLAIRMGIDERRVVIFVLMSIQYMTVLTPSSPSLLKAMRQLFLPI